MTATVHSADEYTAMAIDTDIHFLGNVGMYFVTEESRPCPEIDIWCRFVTLVTINFYGKSISAVVASSTGTAGFHFAHEISFTVRTGYKQLAMATPALISHTEMKIMAEQRIGIEFYILYCVTLGAIFLDGECTLAIMTATTGKPRLHLLH